MTDHWTFKPGVHLTRSETQQRNFDSLKLQAANLLDKNLKKPTRTTNESLETRKQVRIPLTNFTQRSGVFVPLSDFLWQILSKTNKIHSN